MNSASTSNEELATLVIERSNALAIMDAYGKQPEPSEDVLAHATYILSEWLNNSAPLGERRYREPARALLKFATLIATRLRDGAGVIVKPLRWGQTSYGRPEVCTVVGAYRINAAMNGGWSVSAGRRMLSDGDGRQNFPTVDAAKAAAQRDYERRIRSALVPAPAEAVVTDAMRAAALTLLKAEDARQDKLHDLLEHIREQIRLDVAPEHRPERLMQNIQNAVYAMRGRTRLMDDAALTAALSVQQPAETRQTFVIPDGYDAVRLRDDKWPVYLFSYRFEGAEYGFEIPARNEAEAKRRLSAMGLARYDGKLVAKIPMPGAVGRVLGRIFGSRP